MTTLSGLSPRRRVLALTTGLALAAAVVAAVVLPGQAATATPLPWYALLPAFAAAEVLVVHVQYGRDEVLTISFAEVPLVLGLAFVQPQGFIVANVVGSALGLLLHRRQSGLKLAFNLALLALEAGVAQALFHAMLRDAPPHGGAGILAALATIAVTDLLSAAAITAVVAADTGELDTEVLLETVTTGLLAAMTNTSVAMLVVVALHDEPSALVLLVPVLGVLWLCYRKYSVLSSGHLRLERLYRFTSSVGRAVPLEEVLLDVLEQAREVLGAEVSELVLPAEGGAPGRHLRRTSSGVTELEPADGWWRDALAGEVLRRRADCPDLPFRSALAAPLPLGRDLVGVLVVAERVQHLEDLAEDELPLIAALANHAAVALRNARLVDRLREEAAAKQHLALHDALTGLPNRPAVLARLEEALGQGLAPVVVVLGLDGFQDINEALGYDTGDLLLVTTGRRLSAALPDALVVARLGGDEFAVVLAGPRAGTPPLELARRTTAPLHTAFAVRGLDIDVRASVGVAWSPEHGTDPSTLLQRAQVAMYVAKRDGTAAEAFDPLTDHGSARRLQLTAALRSAVAARQLEVHYQPKQHPRTGQVQGAEALVRWRHAVLGPVSPEEFIPLAEYAGLIGPLTTFVLESALQQCRTWRDRGRVLSVAVNLSARSLTDLTLPEQVARALRTAGLPPDALTLEITESVVMSDPERALQVLDRLRALGVRLSVDDFGTGLSSLSYLKRLPVHEVKIDRSFVLGLVHDPGDRAIVHAAIGLVHDLGLTVVAEGVEDAATQRQLAVWGCDSIQGYLLSRPLAPDAFLGWLDEAAPAANPAVARA